MTVYLSIGSAGDRLTAARWWEFHGKLNETVRDRARSVLGESFSTPPLSYCLRFGIDADEVPILKGELRGLVAKFGQDSIAWAEVPETEFVGPSQTLPA